MVFYFRTTMYVAILFWGTQARCQQIITVEEPIAVFARHEFRTAKLTHNDEGFFVEYKGIKTSIQPCFVDPILRGISNDRLANFARHGFIELCPMSEGYRIRFNGRLNGGNPLAILILKGAVIGVKAAIHFCATHPQAAYAIATGGTAALYKSRVIARELAGYAGAAYDVARGTVSGEAQSGPSDASTHHEIRTEYVDWEGTSAIDFWRDRDKDKEEPKK